ncbi:MAG: hypothetical protein ACLUD9_03710 [Anaerotignum faecicola]
MEALERIIYAAGAFGISDGICFQRNWKRLLKRLGDYGSSAVLSEKLFQET